MAVETLRVLVVSEQRAVATALVELAHNGRCRLAGRVASMTAAIDTADDRRPDVVVVDLVSFDAIPLLAKAAIAMEPARLLVVTDLPAEVALLTCMAAGARGFTSKPVDPALLDQALTAVAAGHTYIDPRSSRWLVDFALYGHRARPHSGLTLRQSQVLQLVRAGMTNRQIARALGVSVETVKSHLNDAMHRLGAHDRWDAIARADVLALGVEVAVPASPASEDE